MTSSTDSGREQSCESVSSLEAIWLQDESAWKHLLYGNGLARALDGRYAYSNLSESVLCRLPDDVVQAITDGSDTTDIESLVRNARAQSGTEDYSLLNSDPEAVREKIDDAVDLDRSLDRDVWAALAYEILELQVEAPDSIEQDKAEAICEFISRFESLFTVNYDLLWLFLDEACSGSVSFPRPVHIHGGLHLMTNQPRGLYQGAGGSVEVEDLDEGQGYIEVLAKVRDKIDEGLLPALVSGDTHIRKRDRIDWTYGGLGQPHPLELVEDLEGSLYTFGWSGTCEDYHLIEAIGRAASLEGFYLGVYSIDDAEKLESAQQTLDQIQSERSKHGNQALRTEIYSTQDFF